MQKKILLGIFLTSFVFFSYLFAAQEVFARCPIDDGRDFGGRDCEEIGSEVTIDDGAMETTVVWGLSSDGDDRSQTFSYNFPGGRGQVWKWDYRNQRNDDPTPIVDACINDTGSWGSGYCWVVQNNGTGPLPRNNGEIPRLDSSRYRFFMIRVTVNQNFFNENDFVGVFTIQRRFASASFEAVRDTVPTEEEIQFDINIKNGMPDQELYVYWEKPNFAGEGSENVCTNRNEDCTTRWTYPESLEPGVYTFWLKYGGPSEFGGFERHEIGPKEITVTGGPITGTLRSNFEICYKSGSQRCDISLDYTSQNANLLRIKRNGEAWRDITTNIPAGTQVVSDPAPGIYNFTLYGYRTNWTSETNIQTVRVEVIDSGGGGGGLPPVCGNDVQEVGEECDSGSGNGSCPALCSTSCRINIGCFIDPTVECGNSIPEVGEQCDDGPANRDDCSVYCSASCRVNSSCPRPVYRSPVGYFDGATCDGGMVGWAYDPDVPSQSTKIHLYADNYLTLPGAIFLGEFDANLASPDITSVLGVQGNHRFSVPIPNILKDGAPHQIWAFGIDDSGNAPNPFLQNSPVTMAACTGGGSVTPAVTITGPACSNTPYTATINFRGAPAPPGSEYPVGTPYNYYLDIATDPTFSGYFYNKPITSDCTTGCATDSSGFTGYDQWAPFETPPRDPFEYSNSLVLNPATTYYLRVFNNNGLPAPDDHYPNPPASLSVPACSGPGVLPTIRIEPGTAILRVNQTSNFNAFFDPDGAGPDAEYSVTAGSLWSTDLPSIATPLATRGSVQGVAVGGATLTAVYTLPNNPALIPPGYSAGDTFNTNARLTVIEEEDPPIGSASFEVTPETFNTTIGQSSRFFTARYDRDGSGTGYNWVDVTQDIGTTWTIARSALVSFSRATGLFTANAVGETDISASYLGYSDTSRLSIGTGGGVGGFTCPCGTNSCAWDPSLPSSASNSMCEAEGDSCRCNPNDDELRLCREGVDPSDLSACNTQQTIREGQEINFSAWFRESSAPTWENISAGKNGHATVWSANTSGGSVSDVGFVSRLPTPPSAPNSTAGFKSNPGRSGTFYVNAKWLDLSDSSPVRVTIDTDNPQCIITVTGADGVPRTSISIIVPPAQDITVDWDCTEVSSCELSGVGAVPCSGGGSSVVVTPSASTVYTITGNGASANVSESASISVMNFLGGVLKEIAPGRVGN